MDQKVAQLLVFAIDDYLEASYISDELPEVVAIVTKESTVDQVVNSLQGSISDLERHKKTIDNRVSCLKKLGDYAKVIVAAIAAYDKDMEARNYAYEHLNSIVVMELTNSARQAGNLPKQDLDSALVHFVYAGMASEAFMHLRRHQNSSLKAKTSIWQDATKLLVALDPNCTIKCNAKFVEILNSVGVRA